MQGILSGVRVLELAQWIFVPSAAALLADLGADVIKVEHPETGDPARGLRTQGMGGAIRGPNLAVEQNNRGKRSVGIDLKAPGGRELLLRLVERCDVFVTSLRPRALERLELDVETLRERNPRLIYARGHGLGVRGRGQPGEPHRRHLPDAGRALDRPRHAPGGSPLGGLLSPPGTGGSPRGFALRGFDGPSRARRGLCRGDPEDVRRM